MLSVPSAATTVTVLRSREIPRSTWSGSHGLASSFSAQQKVIFPGWPCVARSMLARQPPPMFCRISRIARPSVAFAHAPGPRQFEPPLMPRRAAIGPFTISHTAAGLVVAWMPCRLKAGSAIASVAAISTGRYSGSQPAMTALIAMRSTVAAPYAGATIRATTLFGLARVCSSIRSTRCGVGGTMGRPSLQRRSRYSRLIASRSSGASQRRVRACAQYRSLPPERHCSLARSLATLFDALVRELAHFVARADAERMGNHRDRQVAVAERFRLRASQTGESSRADRDRREPALRRLYAVVDTPRRAGPSVARARDDRVALAGHVLQHGVSDRHLPRLAVLDDPGHAVARHEQIREIVDEIVEIRLGVVDEADDLAL